MIRMFSVQEMEYFQEHKMHIATNNDCEFSRNGES